MNISIHDGWNPFRATAPALPDPDFFVKEDPEPVDNGGHDPDTMPLRNLTMAAVAPFIDPEKLHKRLQEAIDRDQGEVKIWSSEEGPDWFYQQYQQEFAHAPTQAEVKLLHGGRPTAPCHLMFSGADSHLSSGEPHEAQWSWSLWRGNDVVDRWQGCLFTYSHLFKDPGTYTISLHVRAKGDIYDSATNMRFEVGHRASAEA